MYSKILNYKKLYLFCTLILLLSCNESVKLVETDLLTHGLPLKIMAPEKIGVVASDLTIMKDFVITDSAGFTLQIYESEARELDATKSINELKANVSGLETFSKMILEEPTGFIYERKIGEDYINYDFRHIKVRGDKQYLFQAGIAKQFTLDQVELMYKAVQDTK